MIKQFSEVVPLANIPELYLVGFSVETILPMKPDNRLTWTYFLVVNIFLKRVNGDSRHLDCSRYVGHVRLRYRLFYSTPFINIFQFLEMLFLIPHAIYQTCNKLKHSPNPTALHCLHINTRLIAKQGKQSHKWRMLKYCWSLHTQYIINRELNGQY